MQSTKNTNELERIVARAREAEDAVKVAFSMLQAAEASERHQDMCMWIKLLIELRMKSKQDLTEEERNLFSVGYKNVVGCRRGSLRSLKMLDAKKNSCATGYMEVIGKEIISICKEVVGLLEKSLIPNIKELREATKEEEGKSVKDEAAVFYLKMTGDYYRYLAEVDSSEEGGYAKTAEKFYLEGLKISAERLPPVNPIRLGLALNLSVCYFETLNNSKEACRLAKEAFDKALTGLDKLEESSYKDSTCIMQLLRDNLSMWTGTVAADIDLRVVDLRDNTNGDDLAEDMA